VNVHIRPLTPEDVAAFRAFRIAALHESPLSFGASAVGEEQYDAAKWRERLSAERGTVFGAFAPAGEMIGSVGLFITNDGTDADGPWLWTMYVQPPHRRHGVGRRLVQHVIDHLRATTLHSRLRLHVTDASAAAGAMYRALGFVPIERQIDVPWHTGDVVDMDVMAYSLREEPREITTA